MPCYHGGEPEELKALGRQSRHNSQITYHAVQVLTRLPARDKFKGKTATEIGDRWVDTLNRLQRMRDDLAANQIDYLKMAYRVHDEINTIVSARQACERAQGDAQDETYRLLRISQAGATTGASPQQVSMGQAASADLGAAQNLAQALDPGWPRLDLRWPVHARQHGIHFADHTGRS